jgi:hypothetical protein
VAGVIQNSLSVVIVHVSTNASTYSGGEGIGRHGELSKKVFDLAKPLPKEGSKSDAAKCDVARQRHKQQQGEDLLGFCWHGHGDKIQKSIETGGSRCFGDDRLNEDLQRVI